MVDVTIGYDVWLGVFCDVSKEICFGSLRNSLSGLDILACPPPLKVRV